MSDSAQASVHLPAGWTSRVPDLDDLPRLVELRSADQRPYAGGKADADAISAEIAGSAAWTRQQLVAVDPEGRLRAWATAHDRAAGRTLVYLYVDRTASAAKEVAAGLYAWLEDRARSMARLRGLTGTQLDASPFADDDVQRGWLAAAGYENVRTWLHMYRPVTPGEPLPGLREGVTIRTVEMHDNGVPVAADLQTVHRMLEESFADHFNSYRESFPEFVHRLQEDPGHRWDHWWLAYADDQPAGALVASVLPAGASGVEGSYIEYIGVNRNARGRGVAKGLLYSVISDAAERGRDRVGLEVDADSPTSADALYKSLGWATDHITESWHKDIAAPRREA